jgi:hypothetical protein
VFRSIANKSSAPACLVLKILEVELVEHNAVSTNAARLRTHEDARRWVWCCCFRRAFDTDMPPNVQGILGRTPTGVCSALVDYSQIPHAPHPANTQKVEACGAIGT